MKHLGTRGLLIVFEGADGTGKSTQLRLLYNSLHQQGYSVLATREPTDGRYGKKIRQLYVNRGAYSSEEELQLFLADRKEHVEDLIKPSLDAGMIVLCDRYFLSTVAYQGARGFDPESIMARNSFAPAPDLALVFHVPIKTGLSRITQGRGDVPNDFEQHQDLTKVAAIFASLKQPYIRRIESSGTINDVFEQVMAHVLPLLPSIAPQSGGKI